MVQHSTNALGNTILQAVAEQFGTTVEMLKHETRVSGIVRARQVAMYLLRRDAELSTTEVGALLNRDHTTVIHGTNQVTRQLSSNAAIHGKNDRLRVALREIRERVAAGGAPL
jgi:chromosomal replication initiator protein